METEEVSEDNQWTCLHDFNLMKLLPLFLDINESYENIQITPSRMSQELQMSTEERLERICKPTRKYRIYTELGTFSKTPDIIVFQNFHSGGTYKASLALQNLHKVSRHLKIVSESSPYFKIDYPYNDTSMKIAPGMIYTITISFKPIIVQDFKYAITFMTEGETFSVPIYAIGYRPLLNIPDNIFLDQTAVWIPSKKSILMTNYGKCTTFFIISANVPFFVEPTKGSLKPNETIEINIICKPTELIDMKGDIIFSYADIKLKVPVECQVTEADVYLDQSEVLFNEVYMGMQTHKTVTVFNDSDYMLDFIWSMNKSFAKDELERSRLLETLDLAKEIEKKKCVRLEIMNVIDSEGHSNILDRSFEEETVSITEKYQFSYKSDIFNIIPLEGHVLPKQKMEFTLIFAPKLNNYYNSWAYLNVTGKIDRLPLSLTGSGRGPNVIFNMRTLNINEIFLHAIHDYQVVVKNDGLIPATVSFKEHELEFGGELKCTPQKHHLKVVDVSKSFIISFSSPIQGHFIETVEFLIEESNEVIHFLFTGNVVCPLLKPNVLNLDFGKVSHGTDAMENFHLLNTSQVPIDFKLNMDESEDIEIECNPKEGVVPPYSKIDIKVQVKSDKTQNIGTKLLIVMWGSERYFLDIPVSYQSLCPTLVCEPSEILINFCFLNYEYRRKIVLKNVTEYSGTLIYTPGKDPADMECILDSTEFEVLPHGEIVIQLLLKTSVLGLHEFPLILTLIGSEPRKYCNIICNGQGPVVSFSPDEIDFGNIKLLQNVSNSFMLVNESPIPAHIYLSTPQNAFFQFETKELEIGPEDKKQISIHCYLTDPGKYQSTININIINGENLKINVLGIGYGCPILCEPSLASECDVGVLLTHQTFNKIIKFTNLSKKFYKILWSRRKFLKDFKQADEEKIPSVFDIQPHYYELAKDQSQVVKFVGLSKKPKIVEEDFYCHSISNKKNKVEVIMSFLLKAEFVDPKLLFSKPNLSFILASDAASVVENMSDNDHFSKRTTIGTSVISSDSDLSDDDDTTMKTDSERGTISVLDDRISIFNATDVRLSFDLRTTDNFYVLHNDQIINFHHCQIPKREMWYGDIKFKPTIEEKRFKTELGQLTVDITNHPKSEYLPLCGQICYPTVKLFPKICEFNCIPPNSYSQARMIIQNVTFLPVFFNWTFLEEFFEIQDLTVKESPSTTTVNKSESRGTMVSDQDKNLGNSVPPIDSSVMDLKQSEVKADAGSGIEKGLSWKSSEVLTSNASKRLNVISNHDIVKGDKKMKRHLSEEHRSFSFLSNDTEEEIDIVWSNDEYMDKMKSILQPIVDMLDPCNEADELDMFDLLPTTEYNNPYDLKNILTIEPFEGYLDPYEYTILTIGFSPPPNVRIRAKAICSIEGGENEELLISGISSKILYHLSKTKIEFGRKLFCEFCEDTLTLKNNGYGDFKVNVSCPDEVDGTLKPRWINVEPKIFSVHPDQTVKLFVKYFPGMTGEFTEIFDVEIGYLEPIHITLHGFAVSAQINLSLPRPINEIDNQQLFYKAISSMSNAYLKSLNRINSENLPKYRKVFGNPKGIPPKVYEELLSEEWVVVSDNNIYPSVLDIDLAIERCQLNQHLAKNWDALLEHSIKQKIVTIPDFTTSEYLLDFGYVILDKPVCYTVLILNYGPIPLEVKLIPDKSGNLEAKELKIEYKQKKLAVGEITELFVIFSPTVKSCGLADTIVEYTFSLYVKHGGIIPVKIKAVVTMPRIYLDYKCLDFGSVKFGNALRRNIIIQNKGYVFSKWSAKVSSSDEHKKNPYLVMPTKGELMPGESSLLSIYFTPTEKGFNQSQITITIEMNRYKTYLTLCGHGIETNLVFSEQILNFEPTVPFKVDNEMSFIVQNVSTFPLEYSFSNFDFEYDDDKKSIEMYLYYNNLKTVFIPEKQPGEKFPSIFQDTYDMLMDELRKKIVENANGIEGADSENFGDPLAGLTKTEINALLKEYISSGNFYDDDTNTDAWLLKEESNTRIAVIEPKHDKFSIPVGESKEGIYIVFHGAPCTEYYKAANKTAITLSLPVRSIDTLIYEELLENASGSAIEINKIIDKFLELDENGLERLENEDDYDVLERKIQLLKLGRPKKSGKLSGKKKDSEKGSAKESKNKKKSPSLTLIDIPQETIVNLLKTKLASFKKGLVIDSLKNQFIFKASLSWECILSAIGNVKYIHFILLSYTIDDYIRDETMRLESMDNVESELTDNPDSPHKSEKASHENRKKKEAKPKDYAKEVKKNFPKDLKQQFDDYQEFFEGLVHICSFWDRHTQDVTKLYSNKSPTAPRKEGTSITTKDSTKDSKQSNKKKRITLSSSTNLCSEPDLGCLLWIFCNANDRNNFAETIPGLIAQDRDYLEAYTSLQEKPPEGYIESSMMFTVIKKMKKSNINSNDVFMINNCASIPEKLDNYGYFTAPNSRESKKDVRRKSSKRRSVVHNWRTGSVTKASMKFEMDRSSISPLASRNVLQPGEMTKYLISFLPTCYGSYTFTYTIELVGYHTIYTVECNALCELPEINLDPDVLFPRTLESYRDRSILDRFVYIRDENTFDFGPIFISKDHSKPYKTEFYLYNMSQLPCEVTIDAEEHSPFTIEPQVLDIKPNTKETLKVSVVPKKKGFLQSQMYISIRNNPSVKMIHLVAKQCVIEFAVTPKILNFEKVPLNYCSKRKIKLSNSSPLNLNWKFVNPQWALDIFKISETQGCIELYSVNDVVFEYTPVVEESYPKRVLEIQLFDPLLSTKEPLDIESVVVSADAIEYNVTYKEYLDLGDIKGKMDHRIEYEMTNHSKVNINIVLSQINVQDNYASLRNYFRTSVSSEVILSQKSLKIHFFFLPTKELVFKDVPVYICNLVESNKSDGTVRSFYIHFTGKVHLTSFEMCPISDMHFGYQQINSMKSQIMELKNTGKFPFYYTIVSLKEFLEHKNKKNKLGKDKVVSETKVEKSTKSAKSDKSTKSVQTKKSSKSQKSDQNASKSKDKKSNKKITKIEVPGFAITSSTGEVPAGEIVQVVIECYPTECIEYEETLVLTISEPKKEDINGRRLTLHVKGSEPYLDLTNMVNMFKEQFLVDKIENFIYPNNLGNCCVFATFEKSLYFKKVCVNQTCSINIYLQNIGHVSANVIAKLESKNCFKVTPTVLNIGPYNTEPVTIIFSPDCIKRFENKLEIGYNAKINNIFALTIIGDSTLPQVKLLEPQLDRNVGYTIKFSPTYVGEVDKKTFSFQNIGEIPCKVIVDLVENPDDMFTIKASEETEELLNLCDENEIKHSTIVSLFPQQIASFILILNPNGPKRVKTEILIHIVNNPFEVLKVKIEALGYYHDIFLRGLPTIAIEASPINPTSFVGYELDVGYTSLNTLQKKQFTLINNSSEKIYKFEFSVGKLTFVPRIGHLKPLASKTIIASFSSRQPLSSKRMRIDCNVIEIEYMEPDNMQLSWDDRQEFVAWVDERDSERFRPPDGSEKEILSIEESQQIQERKVIRGRSEPEAFYRATAWDHISMFFSVAADYASYRCNVHEIIFPNTFVQERSKVEFEVVNIGLIPIQIKWNFTQIEVTPKRPATASNKDENKEHIWGDDCIIKTSRSSLTLFSSDSYIDDTLPFMINPQKTTIPPMNNLSFTVIFLPTIAAQYCLKLVSDITSLNPNSKEIDITIIGEGLVPHYCFELEDSDYFNRRPNLKKCNMQELPNAKVLEFVAVGIRASSTRVFNLVNTSEELLSFKLESLSKQNKFTFFYCKTSSDTVKPGKKCELVFNFIPQELGNFEEYYMFSVDGTDMQTPFLLAGNCREPVVYFKKAHIAINPTVLKLPTEDTVQLYNAEDFPIEFKIIRESLLSELHDQKLEVVPMRGIISPKKDIDIKINYMADIMGQVNFLLKCVIEKMDAPLQLGVTASCLQIIAQLSYVDRDGCCIILNPNKDNIINFENVIIKREQKVAFSITNKGHIGFFYSWQYNKKPVEHLYNISVHPEKGFTSSDSCQKTALSITALRKSALINFTMKLQISYGPKYILKVNATADRPSCKFSFRTHDFGYCLVQKEPTKYYTTVLVFRNGDSQSLVIENVYENSADLTVDFKCAKVPPNSTQNIPIYFHPMKVGQYMIKVQFLVSSTKYLIKILGEGCKINIQLVDFHDKFYELGEVKVGTTKRHVVRVFNRTPTKVSAYFDLWDNLPIHKKPKKRVDSVMKLPEVPIKQKEVLKKGKKKLSETNTEKSTRSSKQNKEKGKGKNKNEMPALQEPPPPEPNKMLDFIRITPKDFITMESNKHYEFNVFFKAKERTGPFSEKIYYQIQDYTGVICTINGSCIAAEFSLDKNILTFSNIIVGCQHSLNVMMRNTGDIRGRFKWTFEDKTDTFTVHPMEGFIVPKSEVKVWILFQPKTVQCQFVNKCRCYINGVEPLELLVIANSVDMPTPKASLKFVCPVREHTEQRVTISNHTKDLWSLEPILTNQHFMVCEQFKVEPESEYKLLIVYSPQQMTLEEPHKATCFIPLPEGQGILYDLEGTALPPLPVRSITAEIHCKQVFTQLLKLKNWLSVKQMFNMKTEMTSPVTTRTLYRIFGHEVLEVPPDGSKDYKWSVYVVNEEPIDFKVIFTNPDTKEYQFFEISLNVLPAEPLETITIRTCQRKLTKYIIKLTNPIDVPVTFSISTPTPDLHFDSVVVVEPYSMHDLEIQFFPLRSLETQTNLEAKSDELGSFIYSLNLKADPPSPEKAIYFTAELGERGYSTICFTNKFTVPVEFNGVFENEAFSLEKSVITMVGETGKYILKFEPYQLGLTQAKAILSSPVTGDYIYPLNGQCILPMPKGPYSVKPGGNVSITFYNPFLNQKTFLFKIDSDRFVLKPDYEEIKGRNCTKITVTLPIGKCIENQKCPFTSKLIVTCLDDNNDHNDLKWVYYIQNED